MARRGNIGLNTLANFSSPLVIPSTNLNNPLKVALSPMAYDNAKNSSLTLAI